MTRTGIAAAALAAIGLSVSGQGAMTTARAEAAEPEMSRQLGPDIVRDIQRSLNSKGYGAGPVDGVFGESTRTAVTAFQRDNALPGAGRIDQRTLAALGVTGVSPGMETAETPPPGQTLSPEMVAEVQGELQRLGYDVGRVDGIWGERTRRALTEFQRDRDLAVTGRIDRETLATLEAGGVTQTGELPQRPAESPR